MEYLRASTDASAIVACTRGGAYEGGGVDARVESAAVNVAAASVAELTNAFAGPRG